MLKEILKALKGGDALTVMIDDFGRMIDAGLWMFDKASEELMRQVDWPSAADELYARDRQINEIEQKVREQIVTHLSLGHQVDLSACLVLMSVVKDAERIGDYCKNIFEIGKFYKSEYTRAEFSEPLEEVRRTLAPLFERAKIAFTQADSKQAKKVLEIVGGLRPKCDMIIQQLLSVHQQLAPDEAVAYVLMARFFKRVGAHLANISTGVVSPVPMLDYPTGLPRQADE